MRKLLKYLMLSGVICLTFQSCLKDDEKVVGLSNPTITIELLRLVHKGADVKLNESALLGAKQVGGVVISDPSSDNFPEEYLVIQGTGRKITRGIIFKMDKDIVKQYNIGDSIIINLEGKMLTRSTGPLMITGAVQTDIQKININQVPAPRTVSIKTLLERFNDYESTLISVSADIKEFNPESSIQLSGVKTLDDGSGSELVLYTDPNADFSDENVPANASFTGILFKENPQTTQLRLRMAGDLSNASGPLYTGWPENFDDPDLTVKGSYNMPDIDNMVNLKTGDWWFYYAILGNTEGRDVITSGTQSVRVQQDRTTPCYVQMNFDVPRGASKVTVWYSSYYNDASSTWSLEASTDQGATWQEIGQPITNATPFQNGPKLASFLMDIDGPVRFRINKFGLGPTLAPNIFNGRLALDDFAIYENY